MLLGQNGQRCRGQDLGHPETFEPLIERNHLPWAIFPTLRSVIVVSYKGTNRLLISSLLGFDVRAYRDRLDQSPAALTILDFMNEVRPRLRLFNDVSHYEGIPERVLSERLSRWWLVSKTDN